MIAGKPVIVTGDGSSLWTLTRSVDVARAFVRLLGAAKAINDDFHITTDRGFTWNQIHEAIARGFGVEAIHAHVPTDVLVAYQKEWEGPLMGDNMVRPLRQFQGQGRRRRVPRLAGPRRDPRQLGHARQAALERRHTGAERRGPAHRPHRRRAGRRKAVTRLPPRAGARDRA